MERYTTLLCFTPAECQAQRIFGIQDNARFLYTGDIPLSCAADGGPVPSTPTPAPPTPTPPTVGPVTSLLSEVRAERENYSKPMSKSELGELLNTVAWNNRADGWGLSRKTTGKKCPSLVGDIGCDILHHQPTNTRYDVLGDALVEAIPQWLPLGVADTDRPWVAPVAP
jgi:hypothetical protein